MTDMDIKSRKGQLRLAVKEAKRLMTKEEIFEESQHVFLQLEQLDKFQEAAHVLLYWALPDELRTAFFIRKWYKTKHLYLPKLVNDELSVHQFKGTDCLKKGQFGIQEPMGKSIENVNLIDLVVVPGVAFTLYGKRMGRGGGYYDRLLPQLSNAYKIGVAYQCQIVDDIPVENHDVNLDLILTA